jgi:P27 family predicted phage terminase small subunit
MSRPPLKTSPHANFRPTRAKESYAVEGKPSCPRTLSKAEKTIFRSVVRELSVRHAITKGDRDLIVLYCETMSRRNKAMADVAKRGEVIVSITEKNGVPIEREVKNPWYVVAVEAEKTLVACLDRLGLTPRAREMVKVVKEQEEEEEDELTKLMNRRKNRAPFKLPVPPATELPS